MTLKKSTIAIPGYEKRGVVREQNYAVPGKKVRSGRKTNSQKEREGLGGIRKSWERWSRQKGARPKTREIGRSREIEVNPDGPIKQAPKERKVPDTIDPRLSIY